MQVFYPFVLGPLPWRIVEAGYNESSNAYGSDRTFLAESLLQAPYSLENIYQSSAGIPTSGGTFDESIELKPVLSSGNEPTREEKYFLASSLEPGKIDANTWHPGAWTTGIQTSPILPMTNGWSTYGE